MAQKNLNLKAALLKEMYASVEHMNMAHKFLKGDKWWGQIVYNTVNKEKEAQLKLREFFEEWNNG